MGWNSTSERKGASEEQNRRPEWEGERRKREKRKIQSIKRTAAEKGSSDATL